MAFFSSFFKPYFLFILLLTLFPLFIGVKTYLYYRSHNPPKEYLRLERLDLNQKGEYQRMVQEYERLLKKYPTINDIRYTLGWAYYKTGRYQEAAESMKTYVRNNPFYSEWKKEYIEEVLRKGSRNV